MADEKVSDTVRKSVISILIGQLWPLAVSSIPTILAYLYLKGSKLIGDPPFAKYVVALLSILLGTSILFLIKWLRFYLRYGRFRFAFGVFWDKDFRMHCLNCHRLIKYSSTDPSIVNCSARKCDNKHVLRDKSGQKITEQQAIELIKTSQEVLPPGAQKGSA
jgi:hypothetical protein